MKYSVIVHDLTADQVNYLTEKLETADDVVELTGGSAPAAASGNGSELDVTGLPWDERIHAGSRVKNANGSWKKRKGVQDIEVENVTAELRAKLAGGFTPPQAPAAPPMAPQTVAAPAATPQLPAPAQASVAPQQWQQPATPPQAPAAPPMAPQVAAQPTPPALPQTIARDYQGFMLTISKGMQAGTMDPPYLGSIMSRINSQFGTNVMNITDIQSNNDLVAYAWSCLDVDKKAA